MQIKKDEVREAFLQCAEKEFLDHGFVNASLRRIVKASGTTIGNFYNYFDNKEALFDALVQEEYNNFLHIFEHHNIASQADFDLTSIDYTDTAALRQLIHLYLPLLIPMLTTRFVLLIEGSKGTKYQDAKEHLIRIIKEHFQEHIEEYNPNYPYPELGDTLAAQLINGIVSILRTNVDSEIKQGMLAEYLLFYFLGIMGLLLP